MCYPVCAYKRTLAAIHSFHPSRFSHLSLCFFSTSSVLSRGVNRPSKFTQYQVVGSILHGVDTLSYFLFQTVLHDWCNKGRGMCYSVCGMVHIKEPLLLIGKSRLCGCSRFPVSLSEWSFTICLTLYNHK